MISASCVQSPVFYGHAQMVSFEALRPLAAEEARDAFSRGEDIVLSEESELPAICTVRIPGSSMCTIRRRDLSLPSENATFLRE
jgi:aspartate-semialdehyde dehydrogenase